MMNELTPELAFYRLEDMLCRIESLNNKCEQNAKALNAMMLEMKGLVACIRPEVKKTGWYGDEINAEPEKSLQLLEIEDKI